MKISLLLMNRWHRMTSHYPAGETPGVTYGGLNPTLRRSSECRRYRGSAAVSLDTGHYCYLETIEYIFNISVHL